MVTNTRDTACSSETSVNYQTTRRYITEDVAVVAVTARASTPP
jgi:hypothetical protein